MQTPTCEQPHIVDIRRNRALAAPGLEENKQACGGTRCGFSDASSRSNHLNERSSARRKLWLAMVLCLIFMAAEVVGGIKANSLAVLTDAAHLLSDVVAFGISLFSIWASGWEATPRRSYGFFRVEILGTLISIQLIWLITGILVYEAIVRILHGNGEVHGLLMFVVAAIGFVVNLTMALLLGHNHGHGPAHDHTHGHGDEHDEEEHGHHSKNEGDYQHEQEPSTDGQGKNKKRRIRRRRNVNVQSAYLHVIGDCVQSVGVMIGGAIIWRRPELRIVDLICTLIFSLIVLATTIRMLRNVMDVLMESTPREIDAGRLERGLCDMEEVVAVHELHVWAITVGKILMSCHVKITPEADADLVLSNMIAYIQREYSITHVTIQVER